MAPPMTAADKIRVLIASDNHVGYGERFAHRQNDSWQTFEEIMVLAKDRDVDMVLLAGDLFHDNKPSRRSMVNVMRVLRTNCLGDKPCELEMLSDQSETISGYFNHVNYEDPDINVSLPVFSIHGNHDDPYGEGEGSYAPLDILGTAGLMNYYGKSLEGDQVKIRPVLMQKGRTKLALYGMGNIRDERLYRMFRDGKVKFFRPSTQQDAWFNIMSVHQNHSEHSPKNFLPEDYLPSFLDMVVWGHEHECKIEPKENYETGFHVMQPGSSIATSLMPGEAVQKKVAILTVTGRDFDVETIRLKTVRPFVIKEITLMEDPVAKKLVKKDSHRAALTSRLTVIVQEMIQQARDEWDALQEEGEENEFPKPLIRLRVDYSAPEGSSFDLENTQRFSSAFSDIVANDGDILQPHQRKQRKAMSKATSRLPDGTELEQLDSIRVDKLVREFLDAQTLTIFPQNSFGDAVTQYVDKDDKHAMEMFVSESLKSQIKHLVDLDERDEDEEDEEIAHAMAARKEHLEKAFASGALKKTRPSRVKPKPDGWDTDLDGKWEEQPGAMVFSEDDAAEDDDDDDDAGPSKKPAAKGKGKTAAKKPAAKKAAPAKTPARGRKKAAVVSDEEEEMSDPMILDDDEDEDISDSQALFVTDRSATKSKKTPTPAKPKTAPVKPTRTAASTRKAPARNAAAPSQQASISGWARPKSNAPATQNEPEEISSDDSDDFEPMTKTKGRR